MMRHALFESIHFDGLTEYKGPGNIYCRDGWNCEINSCKSGCSIIHQRKCIGYSFFEGKERGDFERCGSYLKSIFKEIMYYSFKYNRVRKGLPN